MNPEPAIESKFSPLIEIESLLDGETRISFEADVGERTKVAARLGLVSLDHLHGDLRIRPETDGDTVCIWGELCAKLTQTCVVTLEPLSSEIKAPVEWRFAKDVAYNGDGDIDLESEDPPEPIIDGTIDIGEALTQQLALEIDPFPRKPGIPYVNLTRSGKPVYSAPESQHPFAALGRMRDQTDENG